MSHFVGLASLTSGVRGVSMQGLFYSFETFEMRARTCSVLTVALRFLLPVNAWLRA